MNTTVYKISCHIDMLNDLVSLPNNRVASGSNDQTVKVLDLDKGICLKALTGHNHWVTSLIFIERDNSLVSGSYDNSIKIWEVNDFQCLKTIEIKYLIMSLLLLPGGYFTSGGYNSIMIWDIKNHECINSLGNQKGSVNHLVLTEDRRIVSVFNHDTLVVWKF
jgi:WD40 repeat protein